MLNRSSQEKNSSELLRRLR